MGEDDPTTLGINSIEAIDGYELGQNYPNPFNPAMVKNSNQPGILPTYHAIALIDAEPWTGSVADRKPISHFPAW